MSLSTPVKPSARAAAIADPSSPRSRTVRVLLRCLIVQLFAGGKPARSRAGTTGERIADEGTIDERAIDQRAFDEGDDEALALDDEAIEPAALDADDGGASATVVPRAAAGSGAAVDRYAARVRALATLDRAQELDLIARIRRGDAAARGQLIEAHLSLVVMVARGYGQQPLPLDDLIEEGNLGLMEAIDRFDPAHGVRFATYARWWIREAIGHAITTHARTVRLPSHVVRGIGKVLKARRELEARTGGAGAAARLSALAAATGEHVDQVARLEALMQSPLSLDAPVDGDPDVRLEDTLQGDAAAEPTQALVSKQTVNLTLKLVEQLPRVERIVIELRYGLRGAEPQTLDQIGSAVNLSAERVRQLQVKALTRLREMLNARGIDARALL